MIPLSSETVSKHPFIPLIPFSIVRFDLGKQTSEIFFRKVKFWPGDPPPTFVSVSPHPLNLLSGEVSFCLVSYLTWLCLAAFFQNVDGVNYFFTKKFGIYFVATSRTNVAPSAILDIIYRMMKIFRDYCGVLNEESIRKNFVLIYEIIDEVIDYGHAQLVTTENIRQFIVNEPVLI